MSQRKVGIRSIYCSTIRKSFIRTGFWQWTWDSALLAVTGSTGIRGYGSVSTVVSAQA